MPIAYVLINVEIGADQEVLKALKKVAGVVEANTVYGLYDIIVKVEADTMDNLKNVVFQQLRQLNNVLSTTTMLIT